MADSQEGWTDGSASSTPHPFCNSIECIGFEVALWFTNIARAEVERAWLFGDRLSVTIGGYEMTAPSCRHTGSSEPAIFWRPSPRAVSWKFRDGNRTPHPSSRSCRACPWPSGRHEGRRIVGKCAVRCYALALSIRTNVRPRAWVEAGRHRRIRSPVRAPAAPRDNLGPDRNGPRSCCRSGSLGRPRFDVEGACRFLPHARLR